MAVATAADRMRRRKSRRAGRTTTGDETMTNHLPPTELLAEYASGAASPGVALLVATHLTYAPESRRRVSMLEGVGGALLADEQPVPMSACALDSAFAAIDGAFCEPAPRMHGSGAFNLPRPLRECLGHDEDQIRWQFRLPGVSEYDVPGFGPEKVSLLRARPGAGIPQHTHDGTELTLVLQGALEDDGTVYRRGDVTVNTYEHDHRPRILGEETCLCLIVMDGGLRFTGRFSRALNYLAE